MKIKHPFLLAQSILAGAQVVVASSALEGVLPHQWAAFLALLVGAAQVGINLYQHGVAQPQDPIPVPVPDVAATPLYTGWADPPQPPAPQPPNGEWLPGARLPDPPAPVTTPQAAGTELP